MKLAQKLYSLRKKSGLSQEQLAEHLEVSRQAISKWETGVSIPESEKLIHISSFFNVSVDFLVKEEEEPNLSDHSQPRNTEDYISMYVGLAFSILGLVLLIVWGIVMITNSSISDNLANSSAVTVDGRGLLLITCALLVAIGVFLLLKKNRR